MGVWAEYQIYEGGYTQVIHRVSGPAALVVVGAHPPLYGGIYPEYARGRARPPLLHRTPSDRRRT